MPIPVLIDTDAGVDDALALMLAFRSPELSVKAVTTVAGNVGVRHCTRNVLAILNLLQVPERPEVAEGSHKPMRRRLFSAPEVHGKDGLGDVRASLTKVAGRNSFHHDAVDTIIHTSQKYGKKLTIIAIGPLTNLALALAANPRAIHKAGRIVSMGGAFRVPGNTGPIAEFNYFVDPEAAHTLLNSGLPITVIPLDVTEQLAVLRRELEYRAHARPSRVAKTILRFTRRYMLYHQKTEGFNGGYLHDPLAVAVAIDPSCVETRRAHVDVECSGTFTRGMTVADFRRRPGRKENSVKVALRVDRERFFRFFHGRLWR
jgi:inosine-uridine nucleoside N-ribohydrolase